MLVASLDLPYSRPPNDQIVATLPWYRIPGAGGRLIVGRGLDSQEMHADAVGLRNLDADANMLVAGT